MLLSYNKTGSIIIIYALGSAWELQEEEKFSQTRNKARKKRRTKVITDNG